MKTNPLIKELPIEERPRERLLRFGADQMGLAELIAIILGNGSKGKSVLQLAYEIIAYVKDITRFHELSIEELCEIKGLGLAKALQLKAALALGCRLSAATQPQKIVINRPDIVYNLLKDFLHKEKRELFIAVLLDVKCSLICWEVVSIGTLTETLVHPREVFYPAIRRKAASLILSHNHPSGDPEPSKEDFSVTKALIKIGGLMGLPIKDHIIVGAGLFYSMREKTSLFDNSLNSF